MIRRSKRSVYAFVLAIAGCSSEPTTSVAVDPQDAGATDTGADVWDGDVMDASLDVPTDVPDAFEDAKVAPVRVALCPTPAATMDGGAGQVALTNAVLTTLAAGARGVVIDTQWDDFASEDQGASDTKDHLRAMASFLNQERATLLFAMSVVDASTDTRPVSLHGEAWTAPVMRQAMHKAVDEVFETFGPELAYVSFGLGVDRYLSTHPTQASGFVSFMVEALAYARSHPKRPAATELGVTWSAGAWTEPSIDVSMRDALSEASDTVMLTFYGLNDAHQAYAPWEAVSSLAAVLSSFETPVVLHRVAYTASPLLGSSEAAQAAFFSGLFDFVLEHRGATPFLGVASLHDPAPEACLGFAQAQDLPSSSEMYSFWCSTGLRKRTGEPRAGFAAFLAGASGFMVP